MQPAARGCIQQIGVVRSPRRCRYWLQKYFTYGEGSKRTARNALDEAVDKLSANVIRIWAFGEGYDMNEHPIQKSPEDYNEYALQALDEAIYEMSLRNLRVVLTLGNNWEAYGGAPKYVQWANSRGEGLSEDKEFYDNALCKYWYKQYISKIMDRYNGWTGYMYRDDPAIFSYELINEGALLHAHLPLLVRIALTPPRPGSSLRMQHGTPATRGART